MTFFIQLLSFKSRCTIKAFHITSMLYSRSSSITCGRDRGLGLFTKKSSQPPYPSIFYSSQYKQKLWVFLTIVTYIRWNGYRTRKTIGWDLMLSIWNRWICHYGNDLELDQLNQEKVETKRTSTDVNVIKEDIMWGKGTFIFFIMLSVCPSCQALWILFADRRHACLLEYRAAANDYFYCRLIYR